LARGLAYYTGAIIEINVADLSGSLGGWRRYDNLVGMFLGKGCTCMRLLARPGAYKRSYDEREMFPDALVSSPAEVMVTIWNEDSVNDSIALANELRRKGLRVDLSPEADKLAKQFKYAARAAFLSSRSSAKDERAKNQVAIKDMRSGEQTSVGRAEVATQLRSSLVR
jgi:histidyl-tRNA synthetase